MPSTSGAEPLRDGDQGVIDDGHVDVQRHLCRSARDHLPSLHTIDSTVIDPGARSRTLERWVGLGAGASTQGFPGRLR